jgi:hypothetical protein
MLKRCLCLAVLVIGCGPYTDLAGLPDPVVSIYDDNYSLLEDGEFVVAVAFTGDTCADLGGDLQGTVNGQPLKVTSSGGTYWAGYDERCESIKLEGRLDQIGPSPTVIRVWDDSRVIEAEFPALFGERRLELVEPAAGPIHVGDNVRLRWLPASDTLVRWQTTEPLTTVNVSGTGFYARGSVSDHVVRFTVPMTPLTPPEGPSKLSLVDLSVVAESSLCHGAERCRGFIDWRRFPSVTVPFARW